MHTRWLPGLVLGIGLLSQGALAAPMQYTVVDLGALGAPTGTSEAFGLNDAGVVVGKAEPGDGTTHAFRWYKGTMTDLGAGAAGRAEANDVNASGVACGLMELGDPVWTAQAHTWNLAGAATPLGTLGGEWSEAYAINTGGHVVGAASTADEDAHAFYWDGTRMTDLHPGGFESYAYGVNDKGQAVGGWGNWNNDGGDPYTACVWQSGSKRDLAGLGGTWAEAYDINEGGVAVGQAETGGKAYHAVVWDAAGPHDIHPAGAESSLAYRINEAGQVVGTFNLAGATRRAFLWDGTDFYDLGTLILADSGWILYDAWDINEDGWIVGYGENGDGVGRAVLLTPEPATLVLVAAGGLVVLGRRRE